MRKALTFGLAALVCVVVFVVETASARELVTSIDLDYTYSQENLGGDVKATTAYNQKYEIKYETSLSSAYDFVGAVRADLGDAWYSRGANTSKVAPTLELAIKSELLEFKITYEEALNTTDAYRDKGEVVTFTTGLTAELTLVPRSWPEVNLKYQHTGDYEAWKTDGEIDSFEFSTKKDILDLRLEFDLLLSEDRQTVPERSRTSDTEWSGKATYKKNLWGGTDFELAYEIKEGYTEDWLQGVFEGDSETYTQTLKTRLKNSLVISPRLTLGLSWEYTFEQDLLELEYDYKLANAFDLDVRWDPVEWLKISGEAGREMDLSAAIDGEDDERSVTDSAKAGFDMTLIPALRLSGKAEFKSSRELKADTGGSVDTDDEERYELIAKNKFGQIWDLTANVTSAIKRADGWVTDRESKLKGELKLSAFNLAVTPSFEASRRNTYEEELEAPKGQKQGQTSKIRFEYKLKLLDLFALTFSHTYSVKVDESLDEVLNFERTLTFSEDTSIKVVIAELVRGLKLEGEYSRDGSDTEDDPDPELVNVTYTLNLGWQHEDLTLTSSFKYVDNGDTYDDLVLNAKVNWKHEDLDLTGEYQFDKSFVDDSTDELRKLNLKLSYKF